MKKSLTKFARCTIIAATTAALVATGCLAPASALAKSASSSNKVNVYVVSSAHENMSGTISNTAYKYNAKGLLVKRTCTYKESAKSPLTVTYKYNSNNTLKSLKASNSKKERFTYKSSKLSAVSFGSTSKSTYSYKKSKLSSMKRISYNSKTKKWSTEYTAKFTTNKKGRVTKAVYSDGYTFTYKYDAKGNVKRIHCVIKTATLTGEDTYVYTNTYKKGRLVKVIEKGVEKRAENGEALKTNAYTCVTTYKYKKIKVAKSARKRIARINWSMLNNYVNVMSYVKLAS